jgi:hypothetical protein
MNRPSFMARIAGLAGLLFLVVASRSLAEHRATFLGNPATRFADPLVAPDDLRWRFRDPALRKDIEEVLRQWGWKGRLEDLFKAADSAPIVARDIAIGERLPFMSTREKGRPVCLVDVVWEGKKPAPAYAFEFVSAGRRYRCLTPKACSNFLVIDLGKEPTPALEIACSAPPTSILRRPIRVCVTLRNTGDGTEPKGSIRLPVPDGLKPLEMTSGGVMGGDGAISWPDAELSPGASREVCVVFQPDRLGTFSFQPRAASSAVPGPQSACSTDVRGLSAILLEVIDVEDPVEVGQDVEYVVRLLNQGSATETSVRLTLKLPASQEWISEEGTTPVRLSNGEYVTEPIATLQPKASAEWRIKVKANAEDDARFAVELNSDQSVHPIRETESTRQY